MMGQKMSMRLGLITDGSISNPCYYHRTDLSKSETISAVLLEPLSLKYWLVTGGSSQNDPRPF